MPRTLVLVLVLVLEGSLCQSCDSYLFIEAFNLFYFFPTILKERMSGERLNILLF